MSLLPYSVLDILDRAERSLPSGRGPWKSVVKVQEGHPFVEILRAPPPESDLFDARVEVSPSSFSYERYTIELRSLAMQHAFPLFEMPSGVRTSLVTWLQEVRPEVLPARPLARKPRLPEAKAMLRALGKYKAKRLRRMNVATVRGLAQHILQEKKDRAWMQSLRIAERQQARLAAKEIRPGATLRFNERQDAVTLTLTCKMALDNDVLYTSTEAHAVRLCHAYLLEGSP